MVVEFWPCRCVHFCGSHLLSNGLFFSPNAYQHLAEDVNGHGEDGYREIWAVDEKRQRHFFSLSESASKTGEAFAGTRALLNSNSGVMTCHVTNVSIG